MTPCVRRASRSEEHTSELQSRPHLVTALSLHDALPICAEACRWRAGPDDRERSGAGRARRAAARVAARAGRRAVPPLRGFVTVHIGDGRMNTMDVDDALRETREQIGRAHV